MTPERTEAAMVVPTAAVLSIGAATIRDPIIPRAPLIQELRAMPAEAEATVVAAVIDATRC